MCPHLGYDNDADIKVVRDASEKLLEAGSRLQEGLQAVVVDNELPVLLTAGFEPP